MQSDLPSIIDKPSNIEVDTLAEPVRMVLNMLLLLINWILGIIDIDI